MSRASHRESRINSVTRDLTVTYRKLYQLPNLSRTVSLSFSRRDLVECAQLLGWHSLPAIAVSQRARSLPHLREALSDPCPECSLMPLEVRKQRLAKFEVEGEDFSVTTRIRTASKRSASKTEGPPKKKRTPTAALSHQVVELANAVQGIQALLARSLPSVTQSTNEEVSASVVNPLLPRVAPMAEGPREDLDTLSWAATESLVMDEQDCYLPLEETSAHSQSQHSYSDEGSSLQGAGSSVAFSLQDTIKMALTKLNLDPPPPVLGPSNLLRRPDRVARTLTAMADSQEKGLGNMPSVEPCFSSLIVSPDEALKQELRCPNPECRRTDDLLVRVYNTVSGLTRIRNSMAHFLLALHSTMSSTTQDNASSELLETSLQALGSMAFSSGKALGLITQARRQVWLAQSRLPEVCRNNLRQLPLVPGQIFGPAAQEALEHRVRAAESHSQHFGRSVGSPALVTHRLPAHHSTLQQHRQGQSYRPPQRDSCLELSSSTRLAPPHRHPPPSIHSRRVIVFSSVTDPQ
ncbi:hypothetical protein Q8A67_012085 [Cirrhinus molitorella]|uniref:Uncharacterized protein n=1 Tax=Cirrhinus molitorella TaxID=172907 RepID=A0AA88PXE4_9TELE|nr:hypothetical protein Q8A67_012085 [Cirrhinus molitorella]